MEDNVTGELTEADYRRATWGRLQKSYMGQIMAELPGVHYRRVT